jgi:F-type H+-transporting ATPase subunit delta
MAELATIARPYAEALFEVARSGNLASWSELVSSMSVVAANPVMQELANNPKASDAQIVDAYLAALNAPTTPELRNFVSMLVENGRLSLMPEIAEQFHALRNEQEGAADAEIVSAFELSPTQVNDLVATLERKFGRKLNPSVTVDNSLIGGVRVVVGDEVLDTSVRAKLQQMHTALTA